MPPQLAEVRNVPTCLFGDLAKFDDARATYAAVVERFPGSKQAATAKQQLDNLRNA